VRRAGVEGEESWGRGGGGLGVEGEESWSQGSLFRLMIETGK